MTSEEAYNEAKKSGYTKELEEIACKNTYYACSFAEDVTGADIEYCQDRACKDPKYAYYFALYVPEADINYCLKACKGTIYYPSIQVHIMEEALG